MKDDVRFIFQCIIVLRLKIRQKAYRLNSCCPQYISIVIDFMYQIKMFHPLIVNIVAIHMGTLKSNFIIRMNHP